MSASDQPWWRRHGPLLILLLVTLLAYAQLWFAAYSWDDEALIVDNQLTSSLANIPEFFTRDLWSTTRLPWLKSGYYRPLFLVSIALDRAMFGVDGAWASGWAHAHSALWHLGAVAALYALLHRLSNRGAALAGATLFALHPVQSEVLALVAARNDSMAVAMTLGALVLLSARDSGWGRIAGATVLMWLALLSKESAVLAGGMLLALDLARWRRPGGWRRYLAPALALVGYLGLRRLADIDGAITPTADSFSLVLERLPEVVGLYGKLLVWPWPLTPARHIHYMPGLDHTLFGLVIFTGLLLAALFKGRDRALVVVGLVLAVLGWAPSLAATLDKGLLGERYLYPAMAGLAVVLAGALRSTPRWLVPAFAIPSIFALQLRLPHWKDSRTVWTHAHTVAPTAFTAAGLAWYLHRDRDLDEAIDLLTMALEGEPPYRDVCDMLLMAHLENKEVAKAVEVGTWALRERGCNPEGLITHHYAIALAGSGRWEEAVHVARNRPGGPGKGPSLTVLAADRARQGDVATVLKAAQANPSDTTFVQRTAKLLRLGGEPEAAARLLAAAQSP